MSMTSEVVRIGDQAPGFALPDTTGATRTLEEYLAKGPLLLAFHRGTW
jgi:peroxiredoxin